LVQLNWVTTRGAEQLGHLRGMMLMSTSLGESSMILSLSQYIWYCTKYIGDSFLTFYQETAFAHYPTPYPRPNAGRGKIRKNNRDVRAALVHPSFFDFIFA
jgi:hypothetical protein